LHAHAPVELILLGELSGSCLRAAALPSIHSSSWLADSSQASQGSILHHVPVSPHSTTGNMRAAPDGSQSVWTPPGHCTCCAGYATQVSASQTKLHAGDHEDAWSSVATPALRISPTRTSPRALVASRHLRPALLDWPTLPREHVRRACLIAPVDNVLRQQAHLLSGHTRIARAT
jgi:hypothetical protein